VTDSPPPTAATSAATWRVLAATAYDGLLVLSLLLVVTGALHVLTHGEAISRDRVGAWQYAYASLQLAVIAAYFGVPWTRRGQTLAMKAWRLRLEAIDGSLPGWGAALRRLAVALPLYVLAVAGGLAYKAHLAGAAAAAACALPVIASHAWQVATGLGTLPDRASGTRIVAVAKDA